MRRGIRASEMMRARPGRRAEPDLMREFTALGPPPLDPLGQSSWFSSALALFAWMIARWDHTQWGPFPEWARAKIEDIRRQSASHARLNRDSRLFEAEQALRGVEKRLEEEAGPEMEVDAKKVPTAPRRATASRASR